LAGAPALLVLDGAVGTEEVDQRVWEADPASAGVGLDLDHDQTAAVPVRAVGAALPAARAAAAVLPGPALECPPDDESPNVEVDVPPLEAQRLALPQSERERQREPGAVAPAERGGEQL